MPIKDKVIVLKQSKFSESDLIVKALNPKGTLLSFIAKGALKSKKRFVGGVLEPGNFIGVEYKKSSRGQATLHFLCHAYPLRRFEGLRENKKRKAVVSRGEDSTRKTGGVCEAESTHHEDSAYDRLQMAFYFLSLVEKISQEGAEDGPDLFNLLGNSLEALEKSPYLPALQFVFEFRLLFGQGVLPKELQTQKALLQITVAEHEKLWHIGPSFKDLTTITHGAIERYLHGRI